MKAYIPVALDLIVKHLGNAKTHAKNSEEAFFWARLSSKDDLTKLPEYQPCFDALIGDSIIASQLDTLVGTESTRTRIASAEVYMERILDLGLRRDKVAFDLEHFEREYPLFEEAFYSPNITFEAVAYLNGLQISDESVKLSDGLELSQLSEEEIYVDRELRVRATSGDPSVKEHCAVRAWYQLPKKINSEGDMNFEVIRQEREIQLQTNERIDEVINALRLSGIENVYYLTIAHRAPKWLFQGNPIFPGKYYGEPMLWHRQGEGWGHAFGEFWSKIQSEGVRGRPFLDVAIRRYSYAHERHRIEDRVIDLLIAAEALFMSDQDSKNSYLGELRYRLSERAGLFIGGSDMAACKKIFLFMRDAYDIRSKIVHGRTLKKIRLPEKADGSKMELFEFVMTLQAYMRVAIHKAIDLARQPQAPKSLVLWDELIFSAKE